MSEEECLSRIISVGVNSLVKDIQDSNKRLLQEFIVESFDVLLRCWPYLSEEVKFKVFQLHIKEFEDFMKEKAK